MSKDKPKRNPFRVCPRCGSDLVVSWTRLREGGILRRKRSCTNGACNYYRVTKEE